MASLNAFMNLKDNVSRTLRKINDNFKRMSRAINSVNEGLRNFARTRIVEPVLKVKDFVTGQLSRINRRIKNFTRDKIMTLIVRARDMVTRPVKAISKFVWSLVKRPYRMVVKIVDLATKTTMKILRSMWRISKFIARPVVKLKDLATKGVNKIRSGLSRLNSKITSPIAKLRDKVTPTLTRVRGQMRRLNGFVSRSIVSANDQASRIIGGVKGKLSGLNGLMATVGITLAVGAMGKATLGQGLELEKQEVAMDHFMKIGNPKQDKGAIKKMSADYLAALRDNANKTPFETKEVITAGTRALGVESGNVKEAMKLVTLAEDMAALNPGKSVQDAMEALADAKMGEMERMKEFNMKITGDEFKKMGWKGFVDKANAMYKGGAEAMSQTTAGAVSTIKGVIGSKFQDAGKLALDMMKPTIVELSNFLQGSGGAQLSNGLNAIMTSFAKGFNTVGQMVKNVASFFGQFKDQFKQFGDFFAAYGPYIAQAIQGVIIALLGIKALSGVIKIFNGIKTAVMGLSLPFVAVVAGLTLLYMAWQNNWGGIREKTAEVIEFLKPYIQQGFQAIGKAMTWIGENVVPVLVDAWNIIKNVFIAVAPVLLGIVTAVFNGIATVIGFVMPVVSALVQNAWQIISAAFSIGAQIIQALMPLIQTVVTVAWQVILGVITFVVTGIWTVISTGFQLIANIVMTAMNLVMVIINTAWSIISGLFQAGMAFIQGDFEGGFAILGEVAQAGIDGIIQFFQTMIEGAFKIGTDFIQGIIDGFNSMIGAVVGAAKSIWDSVTSIFKKKQTINVDVKQSGGGGGGKGKKPTKHARGGLMTKPHFGLVGEAGPEMIIPLSSSRKDRALSLWETTGEMLGARATSRMSIPIEKPGNFEGEGLNNMLYGGDTNYETSNNKEVKIDTLVGQVIINNESDEDRFIEKLRRLLEDELFEGGEVVHG